MKNTLKKVMVTVLAFALLVGAFAVPGQSALAAKKQSEPKPLTKADFKFTGAYKSLANEVIKSGYDWHCRYINSIDEEEPEKCIKTKRGITLNSTKKQVLKKYGKTSLKKLGKKTKLYKENKKIMDSQEFKMIKKDKYAVYDYKSGSDTYYLYFFFNKDNKVELIIISKNC